jgi:hypothetical protein
LYGSLLGLTTLKNTSDSARYISSVFAPFYVAGAVLLSGIARRIPIALQAGAAVALCGVMLFAAHREVAARAAASTPDETTIVLDWMRGHSSAKVLVPAAYLPAVQYYFPNASVRSYPPDADSAGLLGTAAGYDGACLYVHRADVPAAAGKLACQFNR